MNADNIKYFKRLLAYFRNCSAHNSLSPVGLRQPVSYFCGFAVNICSQKYPDTANCAILQANCTAKLPLPLVLDAAQNILFGIFAFVGVWKNIPQIICNLRIICIKIDRGNIRFSPWP